MKGISKNSFDYHTDHKRLFMKYRFLGISLGDFELVGGGGVTIIST